jgi:hypothetical protein
VVKGASGDMLIWTQCTVCGEYVWNTGFELRDDDLEESELEDWGDVFEYKYGLPGQGFDYSDVVFCDQSVDGRG